MSDIIDTKIMKRVEKMLYTDIERNEYFRKYKEMSHNGWTLPPEIRALPWIRKVISSDPSDAIKAGTRILATLPVSIKFQPLAPGKKNMERANMIEKILKWQLRSMNHRRTKTIESEVAKSALLYDAVSMQVIDLDWQIEQREIKGMSAARERALKNNYGRFIGKVHDPANVHVQYSGLMPEAVVLKQYRPIQEVLDEWGHDLAEGATWIEEAANSTDGDMCWYFEYWDYENRAIWFTRGEDVKEVMGSPSSIDLVSHSVTIFSGKNELPFLPWVAQMGGDNLEAEGGHKYQPLLYSVVTTGAWETQNVVETLMTSEVVAHSGSPRYKEEGPNRQETQFDYGSPERLAKVPTGNTLQNLDPPGLDQALAEISSIFAAKIDKATVSRILQGGDLPSGIAFATLNLATQTAVGTLKPAKDLAQKALAEMFRIMLLWVKFTNIPLEAYDAFDKDEDKYGEYMAIDPKTIATDAIYIDCELHPDTPTDRQQKINAAAMMVKELNVPYDLALEEIGIENPQEAIRQNMKEQLLMNHLALEMDRQAQEQQLELDRARMMMEAEIQMMLQGAMQQGQSPAPDVVPPSPGSGMLQPMGPPGPGGAVMGGQGFNPAMQGQPPAAQNPALTREAVTGLDFAGNAAETAGLVEGGIF